MAWASDWQKPHRLPERFSKRFDVSKGRLDADSARLQEQLGLQREYLKTLAELKKAVARYERMATSPK